MANAGYPDPNSLNVDDESKDILHTVYLGNTLVSGLFFKRNGRPHNIIKLHLNDVKLLK